MSQRIQCGGLSVEAPIFQLVEDCILPGTGVKSADFWGGLERIVAQIAPRNVALLAKRDRIQAQIDDWHRANPKADFAAYKAFLTEIGYLVPQGAPFTVTTENVDDEMARVAGPQLVVPINNARFALNAANARWGSLFDAVYGGDVIDENDGKHKSGPYNPVRGKAVVAFAFAHLDQAVPLVAANYGDVAGFAVMDGKLLARTVDSRETGLADPAQFVGYTGNVSDPASILLVKNGLHLEIQIDRNHPVGASHASGIKDVVIESALTAILDLEDSVAAVDAADKALAYSNWLGLIRGDLTESFEKNGKTITRKLVADRQFTKADGTSLTLKGRSLLLVRNVGHLMTTDAVLDANGAEIPEGILDAMVTALAAIHDFKSRQNSRKGSLYIVKPKMHGPEEVQLAQDLFVMVEDALGLARNTIKMGVMDEERRTSVNLAECIRPVKDRIVFINTGFLDRTGDEIHTSMEAGPFLPKDDIKKQRWITAYENRNVDVGLKLGFAGHAQIGKGMWAMPDAMAAMVAQKINHPMAGANCAWVPSPTAATLHALHYWQVDVAARQAEIALRPMADVDDILAIPLLGDRVLTEQEIMAELENNAQGILGYVVRWVEMGIGCSKVLDINHVALMEDRATLRISAQHIANWLRHGICTPDQVRDVLMRMAKVVDAQNSAEPGYVPMADDFEASLGFKAACDLVFLGTSQPNGYTEPLLHQRRREQKAKLGLA